MAYTKSLWNPRWLSRLAYCKLITRNKSFLKGDTTSALRKFYLNVHPDFFAQHPKIQKINEASLKRLNHYLEAVQCSQLSKNLQPTRLSFYFKKEKVEGREYSEYEDFKLVQFTLHSHDLLTNIEFILSSCGLPAEHLHGLTQKQAFRGRYRTTFYDMESPEQEINKEIITLKQWLSNHGSESRRQQDESRSIRQMNENLKDDICMRLGLREITWCSPWQHNSEHGILRNFAKLCTQQRNDNFSVQGKKLVFTDRTIAGADGSICLNVEDVPQQWLQFLIKFNEMYSRDFEKAKSLENFISEHCGNIRIIRPKVRLIRFLEHNVVSVKNYVINLKNIDHWLKLDNNRNIISPWYFRNLEVTFVELQDEREEPVSLLSNGRYRVNKHCDPKYLINYLIKNKSSAEEKKYVYASDRDRSERFAQHCVDNLKLASIVKDFDVEEIQMASCCERLLNYSSSLRVVLQDLEIRITAKHYSIFDHGCLCIPWNWEF